jgi:hypothetical protein
MILALAAALVFAPVSKPARFRNWDAACDNFRHCEAIGLPPKDGDDSGWTILITRDPAAGAVPRIDVQPAWGEGGSPARLIVDGRPTPFALDKSGQPTAAPGPLLAALANARSASLVDLAGKSLGSLPIAGLSATLRWIDQQQHRVGTTTALVAIGPLAATTVPPPPRLPVIRQPPRSALPPRMLSHADLLAVQKRSDMCEPERAEADYARLDRHHTLAVVGCMLGAYQGAALIVVIDEGGHWTPARLEQSERYDRTGSADDWMVTEAEYDPKTRLLGSYAKMRGLADCGSSEAWAWDGVMLRLASYASLDTCRGAPPGTTLSRWQTSNAPRRSE